MAVSFATGFFLRKYGQKACFFFGVWMLMIFIFVTLIMMIAGVQGPLVITFIMHLLAIGTILTMNILWHFGYKKYVLHNFLPGLGETHYDPTVIVQQVVAQIPSQDKLQQKDADYL